MTGHDLTAAGSAISATVRQVANAMDQIAPPSLAESWDRAGLQTGCWENGVSKVLITLDATSAVVDEAAAGGFGMIISHHPLIFAPLQSLVDDCPEQFLVVRLVRRGISLFCAHTNLDAAPGGTSDCLADRLGLDAASCEIIGRYGRMRTEAPPRRLSAWLKEMRIRLGSAGCRCNTDQDRLIMRPAVFPGSFPEESVDECAVSRPDLVMTGEIKHHVSLRLAAMGIAVIDAGHDVTERVALRPLADRLSQMLPQISFAVARDMDYNKMAF